MLPTEIQRILLLIGLAATGYLMILAWNEDYVQGVSSAEVISATPSLEPGVADIGVETGSTPDSDLPEPVVSTTAPVSAAQPVKQLESAASRLIRVQTPTLVAWLDRQGGDIVRVQLPQYPLDIETPNDPFVILNQGDGRIYVAQSGLVGADGVDQSGDRPLYSASKNDFLLTDPAGDLVVELTAEKDGQQVVRRYSFPGDDYLIELDTSVTNALVDRPITTGFFAQIKRDTAPPFGDQPIFLGPQPFLGAAFTTPDTPYEKYSFDDLEDETFRAAVPGGWVAFLQHYFLSAWVGQQDETNNYFGQARRDGTFVVGYTAPQRTLAPGQTTTWKAGLYVGPKDQKRLEEIAPNLNLTIDYGFLWWIALPLFLLLEWLHDFAQNWGVAIILLTVIVKLVLFPLTAASYRSMANMRRVAPQMKRLQERYADDRQKLSQEMMALYKKEKVNPLGGCLPMLLPMPIFLALYWVLFESVQLRHAPFVFWIEDLAAMDPFFVLPLLMGATMYLQQLMSPAMGDPMQQRVMRIMPVMFTVLFLFFPAGLVLYWLVNNVISIGQQWYIMRQTDAAHAAKS
ncbi:MAG: membrane protein insertase YidC [Pseudomonadales bacterium]